MTECDWAFAGIMAWQGIILAILLWSWRDGRPYPGPEELLPRGSGPAAQLEDAPGGRRRL